MKTFAALVIASTTRSAVQQFTPREGIVLVSLLSLLFLFDGCSHGPSDGKRLASEKALDAIDSAYKQRDDKLMFHSYMREAEGSITMAERSGDRSRKEDVQLDIDLDKCSGVLAAYDTWLDTSSEPSSAALKEEDNEVFREGLQDEQKHLQDALPHCIDDLQKDLSQ